MKRYTYRKQTHILIGILSLHIFYEDKRFLMLKCYAPFSTSSLSYFPELKCMTTSKVGMGKDNHSLVRTKLDRSPWIIHLRINCSSPIRSFPCCVPHPTLERQKRGGKTQTILNSNHGTGLSIRIYVLPIHALHKMYSVKISLIKVI